jgi:zinc transporter ZupT
MTPFLLFVILTCIATFIGGIIALRLHTRLHLLLGFTAGVILSVIAFDILPEIVSIANTLSVNIRFAFIPLVAGFLVFHIVEKYILIHHSHEGDYENHRHPTLGIGSALALISHSFLDGIAIGLAFQVSQTTGIAIAIAVLAHDFSDGINTVSLMLSHNNTKVKALWYLMADALAPALGALSTLFFTLSERFSLLYLGFFGGFLLYICAADILPEAHSRHSRWTTVAMTILGAVGMYYVLSLITFTS